MRAQSLEDRVSGVRAEGLREDVREHRQTPVHLPKVDAVNFAKWTWCKVDAVKRGTPVPRQRGTPVPAERGTERGAKVYELKGNQGV